MSKKFIKPIISLIFIISIWQLISSINLTSNYILPPPKKVLNTFITMFLSGELIKDTLISVMRILQGFAIAFILSFSMAMFSFLKSSYIGYYDFIIHFFRNVPPLSLIPLLILWFGIGESTKIILIVLACFFPMYLNIMKGFIACDKKLIEVGEIFGYTPIERFFNIILPSAFSDILIGVRIGFGYSFRAIIGAEMIAASSGIGYRILFSQQTSRTDKVIVGIIVIGVLGTIFDIMLKHLIGYFRRGHDS